MPEETETLTLALFYEENTTIEQNQQTISSIAAGTGKRGGNTRWQYGKDRQERVVLSFCKQFAMPGRHFDTIPVLPWIAHYSPRFPP